MTNPINPMNYWNEFTKEFNEMTTKNLEVMNKFWKASFDQNEEQVSKNMENYFNYLNTNINYLNTLWNTYGKNNTEFRELYRGKMEEIYSKFMEIYRETAKNTNQAKQNQQ